MRISELLQLQFECLTQDARGVHYLRYMQGKVKRENTIPMSLEIARVIQEQQAEGRNHDRPSICYFRIARRSDTNKPPSRIESTGWPMTTR